MQELSFHDRGDKMWSIAFVLVFMVEVFKEVLFFDKYKYAEIPQDFRERQDLQQKVDAEVLSFKRKFYLACLDQKVSMEIIIEQKQKYKNLMVLYQQVIESLSLQELQKFLTKLQDINKQSSYEWKHA